MKGDYASIGYQISDGANLSNGSKLVIDVAAVADKPTVNVVWWAMACPLAIWLPERGITTGQFQSGSFDNGDLGIGDPDRWRSSGQDQVNGSSQQTLSYVVSRRGGDSLVSSSNDDVGWGSAIGDSLDGGVGKRHPGRRSWVMIPLWRDWDKDIAVLPGNRAETTPSRRARDIRTTTLVRASSLIPSRGVRVTKACDMEYVQFADGIYQINRPRVS